MKLLAHADEIPHEEMEGAASDVAAIDPTYLIVAVPIVLIIGFLIWKFLVKK